jgi:hypothetical protein
MNALRYADDNVTLSSRQEDGWRNPVLIARV